VSQIIRIAPDPEDKRRLVVISTYAAKDAVKEIPGRRWDPDRKVWTIPDYSVRTARTLLESAGFRVVVEGADPKIEQLEQELARANSKQARLEGELRQAKDEVRRLKADLSSARRAPTSSNPFNVIAAMLPEASHRAFYRRVIPYVHPDTGGSTQAAQMLNDSILGRAS
jgi:hypothetical protein